VQYISNGPDIPERLLHAHEEGRVVFFCGAGISAPAGLPNYSDLIKRLYEKFPTEVSLGHSGALKAKNYDIAVGLLEDDLPSGRAMVRREVAEILKPKPGGEKTKKTHKAILELSRSSRDQNRRLVTTNFDRIFEEIIHEESLKVDTYSAPHLPVRDSSWNGLVYLHGLLPEDADSQPQALDQLVISSSDFGLAYLAEGWASRFLRELFRKYNVCFIGYSIDDPVLRYMVDAIAAQKQFGETRLEMFAFASYSKGKEQECDEEWREKNVTPIKYKMHNKHSYLHKSLHAWAESFRDGILGKEHIVARYAMVNPASMIGKQEIIDQMLWALCDPSGLPAKRFAELDPVPPLEWLDVFSENRFRQEDLYRFGITPATSSDENIKFSLIHRPCPHTHSSPMAIVNHGEYNAQWDAVMHHLARWLTRHINDPNLILWISQNGGKMHEEMIKLVKRRLSRVSWLESQGDYSEIERIKLNAPNAIPNPAMRILWDILLTGRAT